MNSSQPSESFSTTISDEEAAAQIKQAWATICDLKARHTALSVSIDNLYAADRYSLVSRMMYHGKYEPKDIQVSKYIRY